MVNSKMLTKKIKECGMSQKVVAESLGIKQPTLSQKINNQRPFFVDEAVAMAEILGISGDDFGSYFFANTVA